MISGWRDEHAVMVVEAVARMVDGRAGVDEYRRSLAKQADALPVYVDMGGVIFLSKVGELITYEPSSDEYRIEGDEKWRKAALVTMARDYPELASLLPPRPDNAIDCPDCHGLGRHPALANALCDRCDALGWVLEKSQEMRD